MSCLYRHKTLALLMFCLAYLIGCQADRTATLVGAYHEAEPPNELFIRVDHAEHIGEVARFPLLSYSFAWGNPDSARGTHKLLVFNCQDRYLGYYYLGAPIKLQQCEIVGNRVALVLDDVGNDPSGDTQTLDFSAGIPPTSLEGELRFHPRD